MWGGKLAEGAGVDGVEIHEPGPIERPRHLLQRRSESLIRRFSLDLVIQGAEGATDRTLRLRSKRSNSRSRSRCEVRLTYPAISVSPGGDGPRTPVWNPSADLMAEAVGEEGGGGGVHVGGGLAEGAGVDGVEIHEPGPIERPRHLLQRRAHPAVQLDLVVQRAEGAPIRTLDFVGGNRDQGVFGSSDYALSVSPPGPRSVWNL